VWDSPKFIKAFEKDRDKFWEPLEVLKYATKMPLLKPGKHVYSDTNW